MTTARTRKPAISATTARVLLHLIGGAHIVADKPVAFGPTKYQLRWPAGLDDNGVEQFTLGSEVSERTVADLAAKRWVDTSGAIKTWEKGETRYKIVLTPAGFAAGSDVEVSRAD